MPRNRRKKMAAAAAAPPKPPPVASADASSSTEPSGASSSVGQGATGAAGPAVRRPDDRVAAAAAAKTGGDDFVAMLRAVLGGKGAGPSAGSSGGVTSSRGSAGGVGQGGGSSSGAGALGTALGMSQDAAAAEARLVAAPSAPSIPHVPSTWPSSDPGAGKGDDGDEAATAVRTAAVRQAVLQRKRLAVVSAALVQPWTLHSVSPTAGVASSAASDGPVAGSVYEVAFPTPIPGTAGSKLKLPKVSEWGADKASAEAWGRPRFTYLDGLSLSVRLDGALEGAPGGGLIRGGLLGLVAEPDFFWSMLVHWRVKKTVLPWKESYRKALEGDIGGMDYDEGLGRAVGGDGSADAAQSIAVAESGGGGSTSAATAAGAGGAGRSGASRRAKRRARVRAKRESDESAAGAEPAVTGPPPKWWVAIAQRVDAALREAEAAARLGDVAAHQSATDCLFFCDGRGCAGDSSSGAELPPGVPSCGFRHRKERKVAIERMASAKGANPSVPGWGADVFSPVGVAAVVDAAAPPS